MKNEFCPECHQEMNLIKILDDGKSLVFACSHCLKKRTYIYDEKVIPSNINRFNWGIFYWWPFWGFWNGMFYLFFVHVLLSILISFSNDTSSDVFIAVTFTIVYLGISIFLGFKGNRLSWKMKEWKSIEKFEQHQYSWNLAGKIWMLLCVALILIGMCIALFSK